VTGLGEGAVVQLLAGMVVPNVDVSRLGDFQFGLALCAVIIHVVTSLIVGLVYGVLLPTLPEIPRAMAWGGVLMPVFWTGIAYPLIALRNPVLGENVYWPLFIASQLVYGVATALAVMRLRGLHPLLAGCLGGLIGGLAMAVPACLWGLAAKESIWFPINLLAGWVIPDMDQAQLGQFNATWLTTAIVMHGAASAVLGMLYALLLPRLPDVPAPLPWGAALLPLVWTGATYGFMGNINPILQREVDWPWFVVSQFVFGAAAALIVIRSEQVYIAPVGGTAMPPGSPPAVEGEVRP
jgi:hypothetical protein